MNRIQHNTANNEQAQCVFLNRLTKALEDSGEKVVPQYLCSAPSIRCEKNERTENLFIDKLLSALEDSGEKVVPQYLCSAPSKICNKKKTEEEWTQNTVLNELKF